MVVVLRFGILIVTNLALSPMVLPERLPVIRTIEPPRTLLCSNPMVRRLTGSPYHGRESSHSVVGTIPLMIKVSTITSNLLTTFWQREFSLWSLSINGIFRKLCTNDIVVLSTKTSLSRISQTTLE
ncbi:hypothetical protein I309_00791 [Cryptococcus deuterogattii LA55]|nr:hypothetical protein I309_00791 [Cryptococcus deuterogattii LA55]